MANTKKTKKAKKTLRRFFPATKSQVRDDNFWDDIAEKYGEVLLCDGFEDCFVGIVSRFGAEPIACYDYNAMIEKMMKRDGMTYEEAVEYFDFNIIGAWVGERTPCFLEKMD